jgi:hypothetical protein
MFVPSGIILPADGPLPLREVVPGLYIVERSFERDLGYFGVSELYKKDFTDDDDEPAAPKDAGGCPAAESK